MIIDLKLVQFKSFIIMLRSFGLVIGLGLMPGIGGFPQPVRNLEALSFQDPSIESQILPEPIPFTVDAHAAQIAIDLIRSAMFLLHQRPGEQSRIISIRQVWAEFQFADESYPPGYRRRFDVVVNQEPLDWAHTFIEYGRQMISMKVLFTYRNQDPGLGYEFLLGGW